MDWLGERIRAAAVQMRPAIGDVDANLAAAERLAGEAAAGGARLIVLPEFFTTGMAYVPELRRCALPPDGEATRLLERLARRHDALVGGSFLCADADGEVRNAFLLAAPDRIVGRHDKDLPTMWESAFYAPGADDGVIDAGERTIGVALCWELMRSQTARRLRQRVDVVVGGSCWWSLPSPFPAALDRFNAANAAGAPRDFARLVGAPVVHAAHCGSVACRMPRVALPYRGSYEGEALVCDASGRLLARRSAGDGPGVAIAEVEPLRRAPSAAVPDRYWLRRRGLVPSLAWAYQGWHGRREYGAGRRSERRAALTGLPHERPG